MNSELDKFIRIVDEIYGMYLDSIAGFRFFLKKLLDEQGNLSKNPSLSLENLDKETFMHGKEDSSEQGFYSLHNCTWGEVKGRNKENGVNYDIVAGLFLVLIYQYWEDYFREKIAKEERTGKGNIKWDIMGELRLVRRSIIHNKRIAIPEIKNCKIVAFLEAGKEIKINEHQFEEIVKNIKESQYKVHPQSFKNMKAIIIPGNGNTDITENWFQYVKKELEKLRIEVIAENMPDPDLARKEYWLPFIKEKLSTDDSILIGHSSGAVAIMRYLEENKCKMAILVGVCYTDLGMESEKKSGYYNTPWQWEKIKNNAEKIIIFASRNDPYIPIDEARFIKEKLGAEYHEYIDEGHFGSDVGKIKFPEIVTAVEKFIKK